ncbi:HXXEE domain-containing protein [Viridibacillus sp. NPDC096237]|uniref:HXXEE domain-containing protein n=1 Tax=Viridibacillus sp. NPDC096237 TaxID=3390721 RepID=UPI003CFE74B4
MKKINLFKILWVLPIIFAIHNLEELPQLGKWAEKVLDSERLHFLRDFYSFQTLVVAMVLLTLTVGIIILLEYKVRNKITSSLTLLCTCLLLINGITHLIQFFVYGGYVPGLITAVTLLIPYMSFILYIQIKNYDLTIKKVILYILISVIIMFPTITIFLFIANILVV